MMDIKPIETIYKGYRFRSRLEARWAVFFDRAGIKYEYEPQGYQLQDVLYLPDFLLPDFNTYFEVKGPPISIEDSHKAYQLCRYTQKNVFIARDVFNGEIDQNFPINMIRYFYLKIPEFEGVRNLFGGTFAECPKCNKVIPAAFEFQISEPFFIGDCPCDCENQEGGIELNANSQKIYKALIKGRQARFEHGEKG